MNRPDLAIFLPSLRGGGAERVMLTLAKGLVDRGVTVELVLADAVGPYMEEVPSCIPVSNLKSPRVVRSMPGLVRYLRRRRPRAIMSGLERANIAAVLATMVARVNTRKILTVHNTLSRTVDSSLSLRERIIPSLVRLLYPRADAIVAVSKGAESDLVRWAGVPEERVQTIYNPVLLPDLAVRAAESVDHPWFSDGAPPVVLGVGRLSPQKDFSTLLKAFAIQRRHQLARLVILGEGEERSRLLTLARELGIEEDLWMPGFVDNPYKFMSRASVFALSSAWEGLPTVLIEVLACGTPVVATNCPSGPQEILEGGRWGRLVPVGDAAALGRELVEAINHLPDGVRDESHLQRFEISCVVDQYYELLMRRDN
ncbi:glycosyltransferase [Halomonas kalidii]|uniref:Glycosyltransferase n=1 Tax=Halomonas kalidii TaxID=3043293 RepID=A0ABT6VN02_9GAMM|nr:glycosyltransferase [Halomonas kalidii]MDI5934353.1 glycosyltransferase [Halomonas kalidii]